MEQVLGIGGVFFKARDPKTLAAWYREHLGVPVEPRADLRGFHLCRSWRADGLVCVPCGHVLLRFGLGAVHGQLSRSEPRRHVGPTPSCRGAGRRPSRGLRLWPVRLGDRPGGQPIRAMGAAFTRPRVSAPRRTGSLALPFGHFTSANVSKNPPQSGFPALHVHDKKFNSRLVAST